MIITKSFIEFIELNGVFKRIENFHVPCPPRDTESLGVHASAAVRPPRYLDQMKASPAPRNVEGDVRLDIASARKAELEGDSIKGRGECANESVCARQNLDVDHDAQ